ncbi:hypothetical protein [Methanogenium organophilum]|uniref:Uncharacterized protein n=1 Tax=Methanogenium organophilum TaxID=2199 RepID=A0A9X9S1M7_METOG|nr:hypothetical protein [Methanogenium organophilum]WAI00209.1 hypothetical protein OU421_07130 [Methanogenium organophilum]
MDTDEGGMADPVALGCIVSAVVIIAVLIITHALVRTDGGNFLNIIRADYWVPSLSLFQFLVWTIVISFSYVWISAIRIFDGLIFATEIPANLYLLLGISVAVPLISVGYTKSAYKPETPAKPPEKLPPFGMMLKHKGKIALNRFQMFLWTIISVFLYLSVVVGTVTGVDAAALSLPDIDPTLLYLMGLSQTGYLGGRLVGEEKPPAKKKPEAKAAPVPSVASVAPPEPETAVEEQPGRPRRRMPESVRRFLVDDQGHSRVEQERLEIAIDKAEIKGFSRFYLVGDDFYYLIDRGQIRGAGKGSQVDIMRHISDAKDEIGEAEVLQV